MINFVLNTQKSQMLFIYLGSALAIQGKQQFCSGELIVHPPVKNGFVILFNFQQNISNALQMFTANIHS